MGTADAPGYAIPAGGEDRVPVFAGFGTIPVAVLDAAPEPFTQRVMELAIPAAERANATVATHMGVSGSALKRRRYPNGMPSTVPARGSYYGFGVICNPLITIAKSDFVTFYCYKNQDIRQLKS